MRRGVTLIVCAFAGLALVATPVPAGASVASVGALWGSDYTQTAPDCSPGVADPSSGICYYVSNEGSLELGVKFESSQQIQIVGVRVYRVDGASGFTGSLWDTANQQRIATGTFAAYSGNHGWQDLLFSSPVTIDANHVYIASYYAPTPVYAFQHSYFLSSHTVGPITALADAVSDPNGVYCNGSCYPSSTFDQSNYWVTPLWDVSPPDITITTPADGATYLLNETVAAHYSCTDDFDTAPSCTGTVANGAAIDTASVGAKTFTVNAEDASGNSNTATSNYSVGYAFIGFTSPVDNPQVLNTAKAGQAIPLKFRVTDANGTPITNLTGVKVTAASLSCSLGSSTDQLEEYATGSSGLQNLGNGYYQFNWQTPKSYAKSCKTLTLDLGGSGSHSALFQFTK